MWGSVDRCTCGVGRCCRATFSVHWTFWFNLVFQMIFAAIQHASSWKYLLLIFTVWGPACLLALVFHEWGHISMTKCLRGTYTYSMLWPLGGFNDCTVPNGNCMQEFWIALFGPLMHIPLFILWIVVLSATAKGGVSYYGDAGFDVNRLDDSGADEWFAQLSKRSLDVNIMLFCLNLLIPAYPMDIATIIATLCSHFGLSIPHTAWVLVLVGGLFGIVLLALGIIYLIAGDGPGVFFLLIGLYVLYTSYQMYPMIRNDTIASHQVFQRDCFKKDRNRTNLSNPPSSRNSSTPPASPKRSSGRPSSKPTNSPRRAGGPRKHPPTGKSPKGTKKPPPRRNNTNQPTDIEMGNQKSSTKKKKAPTSSNNKGTKSTPKKKATDQGASKKPTKKKPTKKPGLPK